MMKYILFSTLLIANNFAVLAQDDFNAIQVDVSYDNLIDDFTYCSFYEFQITETNNLENLILVDLRDSLLNAGFFAEENATVQVYSIISLKWNNSNVDLVYFSANNEGQKDYSFFGFQDLSESSLSNLKPVLRLENDAFWYFYNNEADPEYQELNSIRNSVVDPKGNLNVFKLSDTISRNLTLFDKYSNN